MKKDKFEISLVSKEAAESNETLLETLNAQVENAKDSKAGVALKELVDSMEPLPESVADVTKEQLDQVRDDKNVLVKARTSIAKDAKLARDLSNGVSKAIGAYEKEILSIATEEEEKRKDFIKNVEVYHLAEERKKSLPEYQERFKTAEIGPAIIIAMVNSEKYGWSISSSEELDIFILGLDTTQRESFYNDCFAAKLAQDKIFADEEKQRLADEKEKEENDKREADAKADREKEQIAQKAREAQYLERNEKLLKIGDLVPVSMETINAMENAEFDTYYNRRVADKNAADKQANDYAEQKRKDDIAAKEKSDFIHDTRDIINELTTLEELAKFSENETKYPETFTQIIQAREAEIKEEIAEDKIKADKKAQEDADKLKDEKYQAWLKENRKDGDRISEEDGKVEIWRLVATYNNK